MAQTQNICKMEKILDALKSKFGGVSAKQLEVKAKAMAKQGKTETDVEGVTLDNVIEAYADFRTNSAADKLKAEHAAAIEKLGGADTQTTPQPATGGAGSGGDDLNESEVIKEMRAAMKAQADEIANLKKAGEDDAKAKLHSTRHSEIAKMVEGLDEPLRTPYLNGSFAEMDDEAFTAHKASLQTSVDAAMQLRRGAGSSFRAPAGGGGAAPKQVTSADARAVFGIPAEEGAK